MSKFPLYNPTTASLWKITLLMQLGLTALFYIHSYPQQIVVLAWMTYLGLIGAVTYKMTYTEKRQLNVVNTLIHAMVERDFTLRGADLKDARLKETVDMLNQLADRLESDRRQAIEHQQLTSQLIEQLDAAMFVVDPNKQLILSNSYARRTLEPVYQSIGFADWMESILSEVSSSTVTISIAGNTHTFLLESDTCLLDGVKHDIYLFKQVDNVLYQQEKQALQRFVRVISHEINNAITPVGTIARSLTKRLDKPFARENFESGLQLINERSQYLTDFIRAYSSLAKLPEPSIEKVDVSSLINDLKAMYPTLAVRHEGADQGHFDRGQIKQALCHLINNAFEANGDSDCEAPEVRLNIVSRQGVSFTITDNGPGFSNLEEACTPFYTTKASGNGIGLMLARTIAENHSGRLELNNVQQGGARVSLYIH
ncbi:sensor histidine kinase [Veronia nyctiphanis]|nr:ATP-binding protein [Veronia nyctiphanis]